MALSENCLNSSSMNLLYLPYYSNFSLYTSALSMHELAFEFVSIEKGTRFFQTDPLHDNLQMTKGALNILRILDGYDAFLNLL